MSSWSGLVTAIRSRTAKDDRKVIVLSAFCWVRISTMNTSHHRLAKAWEMQNLLTSIRVANTTAQETRMKQLCFMPSWQDNPLAKNCGCSCSP